MKACRFVFTPLISASLAAATLGSLAPTTAHAAVQDPDEAKAGKSADAEKKPWIKRWAPTRLLTEIGIYGGILVIHRGHELFEPDRSQPLQGFKPLKPVAPEFGARFAFFPVSMFGLEIEGSVLPTRTDPQRPQPERNALLWTTRGHFILQLPLASIVPFVLAGGGALGVASSRSALGHDVDSALHFGGGVKFYLSKYVMMRLDVRDVLAHKQGVKDHWEAHNLEALLGLSFTLGRPKPPPPKPAPPPKPKDTDGDGIIDEQDACPFDPETFNDFQDEDGCPESDRDGDGFWDIPDMDKCPDEPGIEPDGCPIRDSDGDGIMDPDDKCPNEPETFNGFEDDDGCPDEVPQEVEKFMGVIEGIHFETGKATIRPDSRTVLDRATDILSRYESIRIEISGHTDSKGSREVNLDLSFRRAEAVKQYLVSNGINPERIRTRGVAFDEPIATNATKQGRALNRRIEFRVLKQ